jgi:REP element-mobilizing transposase RayT
VLFFAENGGMIVVVVNMENNLPKRKSTRLVDFDYGQAGAYFITVCTQDKKKTLSRITVGAGFSRPQLSVYGEIADKWIGALPNKYPTVSVDRYVIMPNHIHLLLSAKSDGRGNPSPTIHAVMGWLKYQITKEINEANGVMGEKVFQRSFYDHIVRNREDYYEVSKYIDENPIHWKCDKLYVE